MKRAVLIIIDGCRPDALHRGKTPNIDALALSGAYTFNALSVHPSLTLPAHFSIFTSQKPFNHNVLTNTGSPSPSPSACTLFEVAKYNGKSTAAVYSWEHLRNLSPPDSLDFAFYLNTFNRKSGDLEMAATAKDCIIRFRPDFLFIYLEGVDQAGHSGGWMSDEYISALQTADTAVGIIVETLAKERLDSTTNIVLHSDHGGSDFHHCENNRENLIIPWIVSGPNIRKKQPIESPVNILDTAPTIAYLLDIKPHYNWAGG